jgi:hypothetical protein
MTQSQLQFWQELEKRAAMAKTDAASNNVVFPAVWRSDPFRERDAHPCGGVDYISAEVVCDRTPAESS